MMGHAAMKRMATRECGGGRKRGSQRGAAGARGRSRRGAAGPSKPPPVLCWPGPSGKYGAPVHLPICRPSKFENL
jgi:hypothetical protein